MKGPGVHKEHEFSLIRVRKHPWYVWLLRAAWVVWILAWLEFAVGSRQELEQQAFSTAVKVLVVSVLLGLALSSWKSRDPVAKAEEEEVARP
jgi:hypothetical protein